MNVLRGSIVSALIIVFVSTLLVCNNVIRICNDNLGRDQSRIEFIQAYLKANKLYRDYTNSEQDPAFTEVFIFAKRVVNL